MVEEQGITFSSARIKRLILPLIVEQTLAITVGLADSIMVAVVGESAVSAVSLVDTVNVLMVNAFTALAAGGAVVAGQYIGQKRLSMANDAARQLTVFILFVSAVVTALLYLFRDPVLHGLFGSVDDDVMDYAKTYFNIVEISIPFYAVYSAGAALFRIMGNSAVSMKVSLFMNALNVCGNALLIFVVKMEVEGVAIPTTVSRVAGMFIIMGLLRKKTLPIHIDTFKGFRPEKNLIANICRIGVPNGVENSLFQLGKIMLLSVVSAFGTASIAANAIGNTVSSFQCVASSAIGTGMVTIVSQCVGAHHFKAARYYTAKLMKIAYIAMAGSCLFIMAIMPLILKLYNVSDEAADMARILILLHGIIGIILWPMAFTFPQTLKAAGDTTFTMIVAIGSMWVFRIVFGVIFAKYLCLGVIGIWLAMFIDWVCRIVFFVIRYRGDKWEKKFIQ